MAENNCNQYIIPNEPDENESEISAMEEIDFNNLSKEALLKHIGDNIAKIREETSKND